MASVYIDGIYYDKREDAKISVWDHGFLYGDGVFEGIRVYNRRVFKCREHLERLYESAKSIALSIPLSIDEMEKCMMETVRRSGMDNSYIRLVVSRGVGDLGLDPRKCKKPSIVIICDTIQLFPEELYKRGIKMVISSIRKNFPESINPNVKSLNYLNNIMAKIEACNAGVPEAVMINQQGYVTEGTADNIFVVKNGVLKTPPAHAGLLVGITRNFVMELAQKLEIPLSETHLTTHDLYTADEVFLTGTGAELIPVIEINSRVIGSGSPGPVYDRIIKEFREHTLAEGTPID